MVVRSQARLPPDVVDLLSRDSDDRVRSNLNGYNEAAPAEMLLEAAMTWTDARRVLRHPGFPFDRLTDSLAHHPDPKARRLALHAPDCTAATIERLANDPDPLVHAPAAADPRLSSATVLHLLASTERDFLAASKTAGCRCPPPTTYAGPCSGIPNFRWQP